MENHLIVGANKKAYNFILREYNEDDVNNVEFNDGTISLDCTEEVYDEIIHTIATLKDLATKSVYLIIASD